jgi:predicted transcriptional regulator
MVPFGKDFVVSELYRNFTMKMGLTKTELFTKSQNEIAGMAKAIGHPARIAILQYLLKANVCINGDLVEELGLAQATISQHLKELKAVGLIQGSIEGTAICYCVNPKVWNKYKDMFVTFFKPVSGNNCC